jgi:hypothetical protein
VIELRVEPGLNAAQGLARLKGLAVDFPGRHELTVLVERAASPEPLRLTLGDLWLFSGSPECMAALAEFGDARVVAGT